MTECFLWRRPKRTGKQNDYVRLSVPHPITGVTTQFQLSHMIKYALSGETVADSPDFANNVDCSHLCHQKSCAVDAHLIFESQADNAVRNGCIGNDCCTCKHSATKPCVVGQSEEVIGSVPLDLSPSASSLEATAEDTDTTTTTAGTTTKTTISSWRVITPEKLKKQTTKRKRVSVMKKCTNILQLIANIIS